MASFRAPGREKKGCRERERVRVRTKKRRRGGGRWAGDIKGT